MKIRYRGYPGTRVRGHGFFKNIKNLAKKGIKAGIKKGTAIAKQKINDPEFQKKVMNKGLTLLNKAVDTANKKTGGRKRYTVHRYRSVRRLRR